MNAHSLPTRRQLTVSDAVTVADKRAELEARFEGFDSEVNALLADAAATDDGTSSSNYTNTMNGRAGPL